MEYDFKYISFEHKPSFKKGLHKVFSDVLFKLYRNRLYQKLKLDRNVILRSMVAYDVEPYKEVLAPAENCLSPYEFVLLDVIEIENARMAAVNLAKISSRYPEPMFGKSSDDIIKTFNELQNKYSGNAWGRLFEVDLTKRDNFNLIDKIGFEYVKGNKTQIVLIMKVKPSEKFKQIYKEMLLKQVSETKIISFRSFKSALRNRSIIQSVTTFPGKISENLNRLVFDLNNQVKSGLDIQFGAFSLNKNYLYPCIAIFERDSEEYDSHRDVFLRSMGLDIQNSYATQDNVMEFNVPTVDLTYKGCEILSVMIDSKKGSNGSYENSMRALTDKFARALSPLWMLVNYSAWSRVEVTKQRALIFRYISKNNDTLFLNKAVQINYVLSTNWLAIKRVTNDFEGPFFKDHHGLLQIPDAFRLNKSGNTGKEFKEMFSNYADYISKDVFQSYDELMTVFKHVNEANLIKSNMKIQRLLYIITILSLAIAVYSSNSQFFNSVIIEILKSIGMTV